MKPPSQRRRYGRQREGRTTISASISADVADWIKAQAAAAGMSMSEWINTRIRIEMHGEMHIK